MSTYLQCLRYDYLNGTFEGGIVLESEHPQNEVYFSFRHNTDPDSVWLHELTIDEANAIIACLAHSMVAKLKQVEDAYQIWEEDDEEKKNNG